MGKILSTPLHFIGHGRGTVVNSEIIQRLGTTFPNAGNPSASDPLAGNGGIQMTTLDIHDGNQPSLDIDVVAVADKLFRTADTVSNLFGKGAFKAGQYFHKASNAGFQVAYSAGRLIEKAA